VLALLVSKAHRKSRISGFFRVAICAVLIPNKFAARSLTSTRGSLWIFLEFEIYYFVSTGIPSVALLIPTQNKLNMKSSEPPLSDSFSDSIELEVAMLKRRLEVLQAPEIAAKTKELREAEMRVRVLREELAGLEKGRMVLAVRLSPIFSERSDGSEKAPGRKPRSPNISKEEAHKLILAALSREPSRELSRSQLAEKTGLAKPKIDEGIKFDAAKFKLNYGPKAVVRLVDVGN
jgi:hypothetical protein